MAQWSHADRTVHAKVVYYGPAFGGKTTNLESLHRLTDPCASHELLTINTADDRTLFFDLLPLDLGDILGYKVALKLFTVPGQVRYEATRRVVLSGADAIVFVADSSRDRREDNRWSLENLRMNLRSKGLDPARVPVLFQFNKQDLAEAAAPDEVADWFGLSGLDGTPAVATEGRGVLETFMVASRTMLERLVERADPATRRRIDVDSLHRHLDAAFEPLRARRGARRSAPPFCETGAIAAVTGSADDLLASSVRTSIALGERLSGQSSRLGRLEREAGGLRRLSESLQVTGASFDRSAVLRAAVSTVADVLRLADASILRRRGSGWRREFGRREGDDPLLTIPAGAALLDRMRIARRPAVIEDLATECGAVDPSPQIAGLRSAAAVPLGGRPERLLVAYAPLPDGAFRPEDLQFLDTVAGHLAVGLQKVRMHRELSGQRDRLGRTVKRRTRDLRRALGELRSLERTRDRVLSNLSHEMRTPLTSMLSSAVVLRDYEPGPDDRREMADAIVQSAATMERLIDDLLRVSRMDPARLALRRECGTVGRLIRDAVEISGHPDTRIIVGESTPRIRVDFGQAARALANLIDNAHKFAPTGSPVEIAAIRVEPGIEIVVRDRGAGVPDGDRRRIFAPFEQGGSGLTDKPRGTGLGLFESRAVARRHDGSLEYRPRAGGGSEFVLWLPATALVGEDEAVRVEAVR